MGELDRAGINDFLAKQYVGHLGYIGADGRPQVLPVHYVYDGQTLYFATESGPRLTQLAARPAVCFEVDEVFPELGFYRSVIAHGQARVVSDAEEQRARLRQLLQRFERLGPLWASEKYLPAHTMSGHGEETPLVVVAVPLDEVTGRETGAA